MTLCALSTDALAFAGLLCYCLRDESSASHAFQTSAYLPLAEPSFFKIFQASQ